MRRKLVAIVGRPNVGKSALFNRIARRTISIVHDMIGTTRDRVLTNIIYKGRIYTLIDTGGIGMETGDPLVEAVRLEVETAIREADLILFTVDGKAGVTPVDLDIAQQLRKAKKPVFLVVNKIDNSKLDDGLNEFSEFGFQDIFHVSAAHGLGIPELSDEIIKAAGEPGDEDAALQRTKITICGKPNAGKSSLINRILKEDRTIVSEIPGTTRDSIDVNYSVERADGPKHYVLIDTAGIRHRRKVATSVEVFSVMRAEKSVKRADIVILVIDAAEGVTKQDKQIAGFVQENRKPMIIVVNKWDMVLENEVLLKKNKKFKEEYEEAIRRSLFFCGYAPLVFMSAKSGYNAHQFPKTLENVEHQLKVQVSTGVLNRFFKEAFQRALPPSIGSRRLKIYYAAQKIEVDSLRPPTFILFVNHADLMTNAFDSYLSNQIRKEFGFAGCPIMFELRERTQKSDMETP